MNQTYLFLARVGLALLFVITGLATRRDTGHAH